MSEATFPARKKIAIAACAVSIPLSLWGFSLANRAIFPSDLVRRLLGPQERTELTSAPDYMEWDIATMLLMLAACGASTLYLVIQVALALRRSRAG